MPLQETDHEEKWNDEMGGKGTVFMNELSVQYVVSYWEKHSMKCQVVHHALRRED